MKSCSILLSILVLLSCFISNAYSQDDSYFCVPNQKMNDISSTRNHKLYRLPVPFAVSFGGYVETYPECSLEGVIEANSRGYKGIQVSAAYLLSDEVAMIGQVYLSDYTGDEASRPVYTLTGDEFARKVYKKDISYGTYKVSYLGVYRAAFLFEIFDGIPNFNGVYFISIIPEISIGIYPEVKVLSKLTMKWIRYVIDTFQAWNYVVIYDSDVMKGLDLVTETNCNHLFGYEAYGLVYFHQAYANDLRFGHLGVKPLRKCAQEILTGIKYNDYMLTSGSAERVSCVSMTIADIDTFYYKTSTAAVKGNLTDIILKNYYTDTKNYYVGVFATPYDISYYDSKSELGNTLNSYVIQYGLQFYMTPLPSSYH